MSNPLPIQACTLKHFPAELGTTAPDAFDAARLNVYDNAFAFPLAVLNQAALEHNLQWMQRFAHDKGVSLSPHGKTTMSPELFDRQLAAGAWGLTFATVFQARTGIQPAPNASLLPIRLFVMQTCANYSHSCKRIPTCASGFWSTQSNRSGISKPGQGVTV
ncbi:hypothetical protein [Advenella kashmirensis]|uniref:hypothetical protein n=1 Tax=Advenella kashmirensis TaxID=310575 RepID=UPI00068158C1|nr:hypothetical protein [Advenella kashmirensis]